MKFTGIRFRLLLLGIGPALFIALIMSFYFIQGRVHDQEKSLTERGIFTVRQLASASVYGVFSGNRQILNNLANTLLQEKDIVFVRITDSQGDVLAEAIHTPLPNENYLLSFSHPVVINLAASSELSLIEELENEAVSKQIAQVEIKLSKLNTLKKQHTILYNSLFIIVIILTLTAMLASRLGRAISKPVTLLTQAVKDISDGKMETRAEFHADSELEELRTGFNSMATGLQQTHRYLESQIDHATNQLRFTLKTLEDKNLSLEKARKLAVAQNEIKSQFLAHISHEIRTPMNGIIGFSELLSKSKLCPQQTEQVHLIRESAVHLLTIVNEILDYSSIESGNFKISFQSFDLLSCLEMTASLLNVQTHKTPIVLDIENDVPNIINNDPIRIQQVITNLLGNAIKFTHQGHIILRCRLLRPNLLLFSVSDTGSGISRQQQKHLFTPFLQRSEFALGYEAGTGLGLTISKNIVERLHGSIGAISRKNYGSTFWFTLPIQKVDYSPIKANNKTIVLIDHFYLRNQAFKHQLMRLGYAVHGYESITDFTKRHAFEIDLLFFVPLPELCEIANLKTALELLGISSFTPLVILNTAELQFQNEESLPILSYPCRSGFLSEFLESALLQTHNPQQFSERHHSTIREKQESLLIIDDNEINRVLLKTQLDPYYQQITLASNGKQALKLLSENKYDLVFLDLQMPGLSGIDLIHLIKKKQCLNHNTPIIAITAHAQKHQYQMVIDAGFDDCLIKPIFAKQLYQTISHWRSLDKELNQKSPIQNEDNNEPLPPPSKIDNELVCVSELLKRTRQNKHLAKSLFERLFRDLPQQIMNISEALNNKEYSSAADTIHKLHGSVSFCGLTDIQKPASLLESSLLNKKPDLVEKYFHELQCQVNHLLNIQKKILEQLTNIDT